MAFTLPSEWAAQSAVQLTWPHQETDWQPILSDIENVYIQLATTISRFQLVVIACHDEQLKQRVTSLLTEHNANLEHVRTFIAPCNDTWARDHGPITLTEGDRSKVLNFTFNAWGSKYESNLDNEITVHLTKQSFYKAEFTEDLSLILEGGSIESDGNGTLMTTTRCLLNENRNKHLTKRQIETELLTSLGMDKVIWLEHGYLAGDDTDAHIDTLARFAPMGIVYVKCENASDPHFAELNRMEMELKSATDKHGMPYELFPLPMAKTVLDEEGEPLPATYANYLIINGAVLVPTYNDVADEAALDIIAAAHPDREIIGIDCRAVIKQFGSLHCLTMQIPAGVIV